MKIFIFGLYEEDSGKTLLALQLIKAFRDIGIKIIPFKPISGHNLWRQYENVEKNVLLKKLFSYDLDRMREEASLDIPHEILNPVCILTAPHNIKKYLEHDVSPTFYLQETLFRNFMLGRITSCKQGVPQNLYLVNEPRIPFLLHHEEIINALLENASETLVIHSENEFFKVYEGKKTENAIASCFEYLSNTFDNILIEGFNNSLLPWSDILTMDAFIGAAPGLALLFTKEQFVNAINALLSFHSGITLTASHLLSLVKPHMTFKTPLRTLKFKWFKSEINKLVEVLTTL